MKPHVGDVPLGGHSKDIARRIPCGRSGLPPPGLSALLTDGARGGTIPNIPQLSAAAWSEKLISTKQLNLVLITGDDVNV